MGAGALVKAGGCGAAFFCGSLRAFWGAEGAGLIYLFLGTRSDMIKMFWLEGVGGM